MKCEEKKVLEKNEVLPNDLAHPLTLAGIENPFGFACCAEELTEQV